MKNPALAAAVLAAAAGAGTRDPEYPGEKYETSMDGVSMDCPPQDLLNKIGFRGLHGWQLRACLPVAAPGQDLKEGEEPQMVWGLIFQRVKSALVVAHG